MTTATAVPEPTPVPTLTVADITRYICPSATAQEAYLFLRLCQAQGLDPFLREAYLVKYGTGPATIIVGKEAFTKRAEAHPQFDGFRAGVIVGGKADGPTYRESSFALQGETLVGGWAEVFRKDRSYAFRAEAALAEFSTGRNQWAKMPGTMIRKVALVSALREAFPAAFAGLYDAAEMKVDLATIPGPSAPVVPPSPVVDEQTGEIAATEAPAEARTAPVAEAPAAEHTPAPQQGAQATAHVPDATVAAARAERQQESAASSGITTRAGLEKAMVLLGWADGVRANILARVDKAVDALVAESWGPAEAEAKIVAEEYARFPRGKGAAKK